MAMGAESWSRAPGPCLAHQQQHGGGGHLVKCLRDSRVLPRRGQVQLPNTSRPSLLHCTDVAEQDPDQDCRLLAVKALLLLRKLQEKLLPGLQT